MFLADFTVTSSQSVRLGDYDLSKSSIVEGYSCTHYLHFIVPLYIPIYNSKTQLQIYNPDPQLQRAMDNAILNGRKEGIDGDLLVNIKIEKRGIPWLVFYGNKCTTVKGNLI